jgi:hypothetical protein
MIQFKRETCRDLGHISEIFEGDAPHRPCGSIAQAWSVAEILRVYVEEVRGLRPIRDQVAARFKTRTRQSPWVSHDSRCRLAGTLASGRETIVHHVIGNCKTETSQKTSPPP